MKNLHCFLLFLVLVTVPAYSQLDSISGNYFLYGEVKTRDGEVLPGATLFVSKGLYSRSFATDMNGKFMLRLQAGDFEITLNKINSPDFKMFIKILDGGLNPNDLLMVLDPKKFCCSSPSGNPFAKPISLPKPPYPPAARATRTSGEVIVSVKIGPDGTVLTAIADTGHPLLKTASLAAARGAVFETSNAVEDREVTLAYVFIEPGEKRKEIARYSNPYRIEIIGEDLTIQTYTIR